MTNSRAGVREPVYVCGVGAVTGYGWGRKYLWDGMRSGSSAVVKTSGFSPVFDDDWGYVARVPDGGRPRDGMSRFSRALRASAREAVEDAMERGWEPGPVVGLIHCLVFGEVDMWRELHSMQGYSLNSRKFMQLMPSTPVSKLMKEHDFHGPCMAVSAMCASGNSGLLTAKMWMDAGLATDVLVISTDLSATPEACRAFHDVGVAVVDQAPLDACRPFQEGSRGFVFGEASAALLVSARPDGAYGKVLGGSMSHDGYHIIALAPDNEQVHRCFVNGLENAGVSAGDVAYMNAHGSGTDQCDIAEGGMLDTLLTDAKGVYSLKPLVGHCQGAASAIELVSSFLSLEFGEIPAPPKVAAGHPLLLDGCVKREPGVEVKCSLGMGGHNSVVLLDAP
ncbi:MAG: beta-ketoacyl synthase N-terminal-like domain-containing protein [Actinomycetota bacterium]|nr:beta-ketoacyl synthase N-terminal-like domain-containing protein [Actinomycetota bacterium]